MFRSINAFGVELEGGWDGVPPDNELLKGDGSVSAGGRHWVGEMASKPMYNWRNGESFIHDNYPDNVDSSCGLHVHISFKKALTGILVLADDSGYGDGLINVLHRWGAKNKIMPRSCFYTRINGGNDFCKTEWNVRSLWSSHGGDRYTAVNFSAWREHGTVEIRVLPMFKKSSLAVKAVRRVLSYTDRYVAARLDGIEMDEGGIITFDDSIVEDPNGVIVADDSAEDITITYEMEER